MPKAQKRPSKILLFPSAEELRLARKKLPRFKPHDLRSLLREAGQGSWIALLLTYRRRNELQLKSLLKHFGINPSAPDGWERGFFHLAVHHHGVGHIASSRPRTNRNAATWTAGHDLTLLLEVIRLRDQGFSIRRALKMIVADPAKRKLFPYRRQGHFPTGTEQQKREAALHARPLLK